MMFIYLDESGDLGFDFSKRRTSRKFVITLLACHSQAAQKDFKKAVRRTLRHKLNRKKSGYRYEEIKGTNTSLLTKQYFFKQVHCKDWDIYALVLNKRCVELPHRTIDGRKKLYNFLARFLLEKIPLATVFSNVELVVDRSKGKEDIREFNRYVENQIEARLPLNTAFNTTHLSSADNPGLQAVDLFCWGVFRKYEQNDESWYKMFQHKIKYIHEYLSENSA